MSSHKPTLPETIIDTLRLEILRGDHKPGRRLPPERELSVTLGTNRNTLREGLRALQSQGLVQARQGAGITVLDFLTHGEITLLPHYFRALTTQGQARMLPDVLRLRRTLSRQAAELAARRATPEDIEILGHQLKLVKAARHEFTARGDSEVFALAELELYRRVAAATHSIADRWLMNTLDRVVRGIFQISQGIWVTVDDHMELWDRVIDRIAAGDPAGARVAITRLAGATDQVVFTFLEQPEALAELEDELARATQI